VPLWLLSLAKSSREYTWYTTLASLIFNEMKQENRVTAAAAATRSMTGAVQVGVAMLGNVCRVLCLCCMLP